jgi:hypothetical protein
MMNFFIESGAWGIEHLGHAGLLQGGRKERKIGGGAEQVGELGGLVAGDEGKRLTIERFLRRSGQGEDSDETGGGSRSDGTPADYDAAAAISTGGDDHPVGEAGYGHGAATAERSGEFLVEGLMVRIVHGSVQRVKHHRRR